MSTSSIERELEAARATPPTADELRQRIRSIVLMLIPNKWALRGALFQIVDHAPDHALYAMRDSIRKLVE